MVFKVSWCRDGEKKQNFRERERCYTIWWGSVVGELEPYKVKRWEGGETWVWSRSNWGWQVVHDLELWSGQLGGVKVGWELQTDHLGTIIVHVIVNIKKCPLLCPDSVPSWTDLSSLVHYHFYGIAKRARLIKALDKKGKVWGQQQNGNTCGWDQCINSCSLERKGQIAESLQDWAWAGFTKIWPSLSKGEAKKQKCLNANWVKAPWTVQ